METSGRSFVRARVVLLLSWTAAGVCALPSFAASSFRARPVQGVERETWDGFVRARAGLFSTEFDPRSGVLREAVGHALVAPGGIRSQEVERVARTILAELSNALGTSPDTFSVAGNASVAGIHSIRFEQRWGGIPVASSAVELRLSEAGALLVLRSGGLALDPPRGRFVVAREEAAELARVSVPGDPSSVYAWDPQRVYVPRSEGGGRVHRAAWQVKVVQPVPSRNTWLATIDAANGVLLDLRSLEQADILGQVRGEGIQAGPQPANPSSTLLMGHLHLFAIDPSTVTQATTNTAEDSQAVVSSDGQKIAFVSDIDGDREIYIMDADGSDLVQLTSNLVDDHSPAISKLGASVAFVTSDAAGGDAEIAWIASNGTGYVQLTTNSFEDLAPALSGSGDFVVFASEADGDFDLWRVDSDGSDLVQLTNLPGDERDPDIASNGTNIVLVSDADGDAEIYSVDTLGGSPLQLTFNATADRDPTVSGDGSLVVFASRITQASSGGTDLIVQAGSPASGIQVQPKNVSFDLFQVDADGTDLVRLTQGPGDDIEPDLGSDAQCLVYASDEEGDYEIVRLDLASGASFELTDNAVDDRAPSVSDDCATVVWTTDDGDSEVGRALLGGSEPAFGATTTDELGNYVLPFPDLHDAVVVGQLKGLHANVHELFPGRSDLEAATYVLSTPAFGVDLEFNVGSPNQFDTAQVTGYFHTDVVHDWLAEVYTRPPLSLATPLPFDLPLPVSVNDPTPTANAYYWPRFLGGPYTYYFRGLGVLRPNTAYDTIIYHEYGHFLDDSFGATQWGSDPFGVELRWYGLGEGVGDTVALYHSLNPIMGEDFDGPNTWVRNYSVSTTANPAGSSDRQYLCEECATVLDASGAIVPESHDQGEAFAGFAWDARATLGGTVVEDRILGALTLEATHMRDTVLDAFLLDDSLAFGGDGDPTNKSPNYDALCVAAQRHGFDCPPIPDWGKLWCILALCGPNEAYHKTTSFETLGPTVPPAVGTCDDPNETDDGATVPPFIQGGMVLVVDVTVSVDPGLIESGRYGGTDGNGDPIRTRFLYLNAWHAILGDPLTITKVLGTGSGNIAGPDGFDGDTFAIDPDNFPAGETETTVTFAFVVPPVDDPVGSIVRIRLDYGEDVGLLPPPGNFMSNVLLAEPCGPARFGEVEDYRMVILP